MSLDLKQDRFIAFPAQIWENAKSKEDLETWLMAASEEDEASPLVVVKDYLSFLKGEVPIELQFFPNGDILAVLPNTDLVAEGNNFVEAKQNLSSAIEDDYAYLSQRQDTLGKELSEQLQYLQEISASIPLES